MKMPVENMMLLFIDENYKEEVIFVIFLWKQRWNKKDDVCYSVGIFICQIVDGISIGNFKSN